MDGWFGFVVIPVRFHSSRTNQLAKGKPTYRVIHHVAITHLKQAASPLPVPMRIDSRGCDLSIIFRFADLENVIWGAGNVQWARNYIAIAHTHIAALSSLATATIQLTSAWWLG